MTLWVTSNSMMRSLKHSEVAQFSERCEHERQRLDIAERNGIGMTMAETEHKKIIDYLELCLKFLHLS